MGKRQRRSIFSILILAAMALFAGVILQTKVNPLTEELAVAKINDLASNLINQAVGEQIEEGNVQYEDLVFLNQDAQGNVTALTTNMREMNRLKTQLLTKLDSDIYNISGDEINIPVGNLTGIPLLSGRWGSIPVKIVAVSSSDANFRGEFEDAGINQTIHRIMMDVALDLIILLPSGTVTDHVSTEVCVAETVLLGRVPESYTYFNGGTGDSLGLYAASGG